MRIFLLVILSCVSLNVFAQTYSSTGAVTVMPGIGCPGLGEGAASIINVTPSGTIYNPGEITVKMALKSACRAAVLIVLYAPDGDSCILINRIGRIGGCSASCVSYIESDILSFNAANTVSVPGSGVAAAGDFKPTAGPFYPEIGNLSTFLNGKSVKGNWSLVGYSDAGVDLEISSWNISFGATVLPLSLTRFSGSNTPEGDNMLSWSTASEKNMLSFDLEKSIDGQYFKRIGSLNAIGTGNNNYFYTDQNPKNSNSLYRLKMIDKDQSHTYSRIVKLVRSDVPSKILVSPNPARDHITFEFSDSTLLNNTNAAIYDQSGRNVFSFEINKSTQIIPISALSSGTYICKFANGEVVQFRKI